MVDWSDVPNALTSVALREGRTLFAMRDQNDLARGWTGLTLAHVGLRLLTRSPVVHFDGPRSVEGAFTPAEALALAAKAGLKGATVARRWPCRFLLTWERP